MIVGIDAGNHEVKVFGEKGEDKFLSLLGEYRERRLQSKFSDDDMIYEFDGEKGFAGTLAKHESEFAASKMGDSKAHKETLIRVLLALHRYSDSTEYQIAVSQPVDTHTEEEKLKIKQMIKGEHEFKLNGKLKRINITRVEVSPEGGAAFWSNPKKGLVRVLDFGSGTVNGVTMWDMAYIDKDSFTERFGLNTTINTDLKNIVRKSSLRALQKWDEKDVVEVAGGAAHKLIEHVKHYFPNAIVLKPQPKFIGRHIILEPIYANAVGNYHAMKGAFGK